MREPTSAPAPHSATPARDVACADALAWLAARSPLPGASFITSLPDLSELTLRSDPSHTTTATDRETDDPRHTPHARDPGHASQATRDPRPATPSTPSDAPPAPRADSPLPFPAWRAWFIDAAAAVLRACPPEGVAIFYQTDIRHEGRWIDKSHLVQLAADRSGHQLVWHKIACRKPAGTITLGRPAYAHLLCFSAAPRPEPVALPDVFATGAMTWSRATGVDACRLACTYILRHTATRTVVDPFCGRGTVLAVANTLGLAAVGIDHSPKRCRAAATLTLADTDIDTDTA